MTSMKIAPSFVGRLGGVGALACSHCPKASIWRKREGLAGSQTQKRLEFG